MTETSNAFDAAGASSGKDPRPSLMQAIALAGETLSGIRPDQYDNPTPCPDYDVRAVANHFVSVLRRIAVLGTGGDFFSVPHFAEDVAEGEWDVAWEAGAREAAEAWADPASLERQIVLPWTSQSGAVMAASYTTEVTLHTWDLAQATGQQPKWDPEVLGGQLAVMREAMPAQPRGNPVPFGPVVEVPENAPEIDRLVGWYGRKP
ncbi:TIGR03086 family metal-binding protein [Streptomyces sp. NBC_00280]|uniref:TIGR03086 family metal-binding protein n=1 Tax=Streptomyces sp. NBC_00280 TaxID=2975699 RepID=UPI003243F94E